MKICIRIENCVFMFTKSQNTVAFGVKAFNQIQFNLHPVDVH